MRSDSTNSASSDEEDVVHLHKEDMIHLQDTSKSFHRRNSQNGSLAHHSELQTDNNGWYHMDKSKPETFLNSDDIEKVTESEVYVQKRLFSRFHSKKIPPIPETDDERKVYPLLRTNIISKIFFLWVIPIIRVGYKRTLQPGDLWKMDERLSIETLYQTFSDNMDYYFDNARKQYKEEHPEASDKEVISNAKLPRTALIKSLFWTFRIQYTLALVFVCIANAASALTPLLTKKLINFVELKSIFPHKHVNAGVGYAIGSVVLLLINGIAFNHFFNCSGLTGVEVKAVLTKAILIKTMKLSSYSKHKFPNGKVTSLMTTDVSRLELAVMFHPLIYGFPIVLIICLVLLLVNLGPVALLGFAILFLVLAVNVMGFKRFLKYRIANSKITDQRVGMMREILNSIKMIKFYAWEDAYEKNVIAIRAIESRYVRSMQIIKNILVTSTISYPNIASFVVFLVMYKVNNGARSPANIFASLSLFQIMMIQMFLVPLAASTSLDAFVAFGRIQQLLEAEEAVDTVNENEEDLVLDDDIVLKAKNASFEWDNYELEDAKDSAKARGEEFSLIDKSSVDTEKKFSKGIEKVPFTGFHDLNFEIKKKEFIIITGPIGTGKSSLLNALAGFMTKTGGSLSYKGDLLFCGESWAQNATVRDNITFGSPFDEKKYRRVIDICALQVDLDILPAGDKTEIGERGITLSGGQKARITLARSVYKDMDIYLFDDVLSAVDSRVCQHIVDNCMLDYLKEKTIILATHQLSLIGHASRVIFLGSDGSVDFDTVPELLKRNTAFSSLMKFQNGQPIEEQDKTSEDVSEGADVRSKTDAARLKKMFSENAALGKLGLKEERAVNGLGFNVYKSYLEAACGKYAPLFAVLFLLLVIVSTFCPLFSSVWLSYWTSYKFENRSDSFYMGLYALFIFTGTFFMFFQFACVGLIATYASKWLNLRALHRLLHAPMSFMDVTPMGRVMNRFTKDTDTLDNEIGESLRLVSYQIAYLIGIVILCIAYMPWFAIAMPFLAFTYIFVAAHYQASALEIKRMEAVQRSFVYNNFNEVLGGLDTIKAFRCEERFLMKSDFLINKMNEAGYLVVNVQRWVAISLDVLAVCFALIIALLCVTRQFKVNAGAVGVMLTYVLQLPGLLNGLLRSQTQVENDLNSAERLVSYANDLPIEAKYHIPETMPSEDWPSEGNISFENVSLAYRPELPNVLNNVSFNIRTHEKVGICGRTGAGKSTIMSSLYRIVELKSGKITIDNIDISTIGLHDLRSKLSIIPQDPVLFKGDIRRNLDPFHECSDDQLWDALVRGGALAKEELEAIKDQHVDANGLSGDMFKFHLDQKVEDDGANFSLGERQVLALCRALVRNTRILILDEATSSVDYETDAKIQSSIVEEFSHCTILCIAHRLKTILNYDRILVLDQGEVKEFDTPIALFNDRNTIFYDMCCGAGIVEADFKKHQI